MTLSSSAWIRIHRLDQLPGTYSSNPIGSKIVTGAHSANTISSAKLQLTMRDSSTTPSRPSSRAFSSSQPKPSKWARCSWNLISMVTGHSIMGSSADQNWSKTCRACPTSKISDRSSIRLIRINLARSSTLNLSKYPLTIAFSSPNKTSSKPSTRWLTIQVWSQRRRLRPFCPRRGAKKRQRAARWTLSGTTSRALATLMLTETVKSLKRSLWTPCSN